MQDQARGRGGWQAIICTAACCFHLQAGAVHMHTLSHAHLGTHTHKNTLNLTVYTLSADTRFDYIQIPLHFYCMFSKLRKKKNLNDE